MANSGRKPSASASAKKKTTSGTRKKKTEFEEKSKALETRKRQSRKVYDDHEIEPERDDFRNYYNNTHDNKVRQEIALVAAGLVSILFILSYLDICGVVGKVLNAVSFSLMGVFAYIFPVFLFASVIYSIKARKKKLARKRITLCMIMAVCVMALIHTISCYNKVTLLKTFKYCYENKKGGGFIGALIAVPFGKLFGKVGTMLILIAALIILLIMLTGKAIFHLIKQRTEEEYKDLSEKHKENKAKREREKFERSAEEGRIKYERLNSDKSWLYKADIDPENSYIVKRNKKNERSLSFVEKLKSGNLDQNPKSEVRKKPETKDDPAIKPSSESVSLDVEKINHEMDMIEITGYEKQEKSVYEQELERKFGGNAGFDDSALTGREDEESSVFEPVKEDKKAENLPYETQKNKYEDIGLFARGEYHPEGEKSIQSHSLAGKQGTGSSTPLDNAKSAALIKKGEKQKSKKAYVFPPVSLLAKTPPGAKGTSKAELEETAKKLQDTLKSFGVNVTITNKCCGPSVTRYELQPEVGVKVSKITSLSDDIKLNLAAADIRMEAPIPGKSAIGIEVPNKVNQKVFFSSLVDSEEFKNSKSKLTFAVGKDIGGQVIVFDIAKMPHLLIAGATGSGKSVCINTLIMSLIYKSDPEDVKLILVDPKVVELSVYNGLPHLLIPVVTDPKKASGALNWAVMEMNDRYRKFADLGVRDLTGYNKKVAERKGELKGSNGEIYEKLPQIVFVIDELADLMMVAPGEVEDYIIRLTQLARACGIHLVIATQRPSVNVITGLIKANVPSRIAFSVASQVDSRTILDMAGAEKLLGKGDMLFYPTGYTKPVRVQGAFISDTEVGDIVEYVKSHNSEADTSEMEERIAATPTQSTQSSSGGQGGSDSDSDELIYKAGLFIIEKEKASIGSLQRQFKIGFNRAARIMDQLSEAGVVGPEEGTKPRQILMSTEAFEQYAAQNGLK